MDPHMFVMQKKLKKEPHEYTNMPEHAAVALKKISRGEEVNPGDVINFVYIQGSDLTDNNYKRLLSHKTKKDKDLNLHAGEKGGDIVEDAKFAFDHGVQLNMRHYLDRCILNKVADLISTWFAHPNEYPTIPDDAEPDAMTLEYFKQLQKTVLVKQKSVATDVFLTGTIERQRQLGDAFVSQASHLKRRQSVLVGNHVNHCNYCTMFFRGAKDTKFCTSCTKKGKAGLKANILQDLEEANKVLTKCNEACDTCVRATGLATNPDDTLMIDYNKCDRTGCVIHKKKIATTLSVSNLNAKMTRCIF
jgi:hypothetical protein